MSEISESGNLRWANIIAVVTLAFLVVSSAVAATFYLNRQTAKDNAEAIRNARREAYLRSVVVWEIMNERLNTLRAQHEELERIEPHPLPEPE